MKGKGGFTKVIVGQEEPRLHPIVQVGERLGEDIRTINTILEANIDVLSEKARMSIEQRKSDALKRIFDILKNDVSAEGKAIKELLRKLAAADRVKIAGKPDGIGVLLWADLAWEDWERKHIAGETYLSTYGLTDMGKRLYTLMEVGKEKRE